MFEDIFFENVSDIDLKRKEMLTGIEVSIKIKELKAAKKRLDFIQREITKRNTESTGKIWRL